MRLFRHARKLRCDRCHKEFLFLAPRSADAPEADRSTKSGAGSD